VNLDREGTILGRIVDIVSSRLYDLEMSVYDLYRCYNPNEAEGVYLDNLLEGLLGISRLGESRSTLLLTLSGVAGTEVPKHTLFEDSSSQLWRSTETCTIGAGGSVVVGGESVDYGPIYAGPEEINKIVTSVTGLEGVSNSGESNTGYYAESNAEYRLRKEKELLRKGSAYAAAIRKHVEALGLRCRVIENRGEEDIDVDGYTITEKSFMVLVYPDDISWDMGSSIAKVIWQHGPAGIETVGDYSREVSDEVGETQTVRWMGGAISEYDVNVVRKPVRSEDEAVIEAVCGEYFATLDIGEKPSRGTLGCLIKRALPHLSEYYVLYTGSVTEREVATLGEVTYT